MKIAYPEHLPARQQSRVLPQLIIQIIHLMDGQLMVKKCSYAVDA
ncbi:hypothetical protein [Paracidobacterium acidisoli]|nr:hypothetical protein [Paracidobacterium acidisoli]